MPSIYGGTADVRQGADDSGMTFPMDYSNLMYGDNSAAIGQGLGQSLSNLSPSQLVYDPFQFQRPQYMDMLQKLASDPSSITQTPWYASGIESVKRGMSKGYLDSGNMALALSKYGQDAYYKQISTLAALAGAGQGPTNVGNSIVGGKVSGADLISKSLGTQRYQDLQRLLQQAKGGNSGNNPGFWGPAGNTGGTKLPPYSQKPQQPGQPQPKPGENQNQDDMDWENQLRDIFGLGPDDDISNIMDMFGGDEGGGNDPGADYSDFYGDTDWGGGDFGGGE